MTKEYLTPDGSRFDDGMIDRWCADYESGRFPEGERSSGKIVYGRPPLSQDSTAVLSIKMPAGMKKAIEKTAKEKGLTPSAFTRAALADKLLAG